MKSRMPSLVLLSMLIFAVLASLPTIRQYTQSYQFESVVGGVSVPEEVASLTYSIDLVREEQLNSDQNVDSDVKNHIVGPFPICQNPKSNNQVRHVMENILNSVYGQVPIEDLLQSALSDKTPERTRMNLALLVRKNESLTLLKEMLPNSTDDAFLYDLVMLIQSQLRWKDLSPFIFNILEDESRSDLLRARAATAMALFENKDAVPAVRALLKNTNDPQARQLAAMALGSFGDSESIKLIHPLLQDSSPFVRITAAGVMGILGNAGGEDIAVGFSYADNFGLRSLAAEALHFIDTPTSHERLSEMVANDPSHTVRKEIAALQKRAFIDEMPEAEAIDYLSKFLTNEGGQSEWAFFYLANYFGPNAAHVFQSLVQTNGLLREASIVALIEIDSEIVMKPRY